MTTFRGLTMIGSGGALLNITFRFCCVYGNHLSAIMACGLHGNGGSLSITTFLGGGGNLVDRYKI